MSAIDNPDLEVDILRDVGALAARLPEWAERAVVGTAYFAVPAALTAVVLLAWLAVRRHPDAPQAVAAVAWSALAAVVAFLVNIPIRGFVARPRPFEDHPDAVTVLTGGHGTPTGYSFVSDHASVAMAVAVGLFLVHRGLGAAACGLALVQGFTQVLMGVHYPTDVIGGFALGTAVALLLAPLAMAVLTPLARRCGRSRRLRRLVVARPGADEGADGGSPEPAGRSGERDGAEHPVAKQRGLAA
ncbi:phosphatase PAP2 family protein [Streptomyces sp. B6B3]|uniref:phosphatase PAP2 family protein n=1 Tax=Streptomyces sp. B6B3 TaxID=3153570 RepID=UPI00325E68B9